VTLNTKVEEDAVRAAAKTLSKGTFARTLFVENVLRVGPARDPSVVTEECSGPFQEGVERVLEREINARFSASSCPFRVIILRRCESEGDAVVIAGRHVNFDGLSAIELLRRLLILVREPSAEFPDSVVANSDSYVMFGGYMPILMQALLVAWEGLREIRWGLMDSHSRKPSGAPSALNVSEAGSSSRSHACCVHLTLSPKDT
jgi:hypothetical protein